MLNEDTYEYRLQVGGGEESGDAPEPAATHAPWKWELLRGIDPGEITAIEADSYMEIRMTPEGIVWLDRLTMRHKVMDVGGIRTVAKRPGLLRVGITHS